MGRINGSSIHQVGEILTYVKEVETCKGCTSNAHGDKPSTSNSLIHQLHTQILVE